MVVLVLESFAILISYCCDLYWFIMSESVCLRIQYYEVFVISVFLFGFSLDRLFLSELFFFFGQSIEIKACLIFKRDILFIIQTSLCNLLHSLSFLLRLCLPFLLKYISFFNGIFLHLFVVHFLEERLFPVFLFFEYQLHLSLFHEFFQALLRLLLIFEKLCVSLLRNIKSLLQSLEHGSLLKLFGLTFLI